MMDKIEKNWHVFALAACLASVVLGMLFGYFISGRSLVIAHNPLPEPLEYEAAIEAVYLDIPEVIAPPILPAYTQTEPTYRYVVTVVDGFVAVFYAAHTGGALKEMTTSPVSTLPAYDQQRLQAGILIYNEEALARILQDYGS